MSKTPISILQELMVQKKERLPDYYIESCSGSPGVSFMCTVTLDQLKAVGFASTKKDAKQNSARKALELLGYKNTIQQQMPYNQTTTTTTTTTTTLQNHNQYIINYVGKLNEYASMQGWPYPSYKDELNGRFVTRCCFLQWTTEGIGINKKDSKQDAARKMLDKLKTENDSIIINKMEVLELNKIEKVNKLNQEILKSYEKLSSSVNNAASTFTEFSPIPNLKKNVTSVEELKIEMEKFGYRCSPLKTYQRDPYIVMMKIEGTKAVLMGNGKTKGEAINDLFESALYMFNYGFSLSTEL